MHPARTAQEDAGALHEAEERFRIAFDSAGIGMALMGLDGRFLRVNEELCHIVGRSEAELLDGPGIRSISHPANLAERREDFRDLLLGTERSYRRDRRYLHADGHQIWGATTLSLVRDGDGRALYAIGQLEDITARKHAEQRAERQAAQQAAVAQLSQLALVEQDFAALADATVRTITQILSVSFAAIAQHAPETVDGVRFVSGAQGGESSDLWARLDEHHAAYTLARGAAVIVRDAETEGRFDADGLLRRGIASGVATPIGGEGDEPFGVLGMYATEARAFSGDDLSFLQAVANVLTGAVRRLAAENGLRHQSLHDPLTQLPNRALLLDRLRLGMARVRREGGWLAVLFLDLDDFKGVNDSLGHAAGDALLRDLAPRLSAALRTTDTLARFGGDEFAIVCDALEDPSEAVLVAGRVLEVVGAPRDIGGGRFVISGSIGIALADRETTRPPEDLLRDADVAMYRAKSAGRGRFELFDDQMRAETVERVELTNELRAAIEQGDLRLVFQPLISIAQRRVVAVEALARWDHPVRGEIPPSRFVPLAEEHGLVGALGSWVVEEALDHLASWQRAGVLPDGFELAVNVSRRQLTLPSLAREVIDAMRERAVQPGSFVIELTESALVEDAGAALATVTALREAGVRVVLDDFGVGQSSLASIRDFPLDAIKLDRGFMRHLATGPKGAAIVRAIVAMARALDLAVVAEGIETGDQAAAVAALGCELGQGYLFARPVPADQLVDTIAAVDAALRGDVPVAAE